MIIAGAPIAGNVLISSTLQIAAAGVNPAAIVTNTGDVVVRGTLIAERSSGSTTNAINISAPSGTIYILGSIQTSGTPGTIDNPNAGNLSLTAKRIVVDGTVDASGEASTTAAGGHGGTVTLDTTGAGGTDILFTGGILKTAGGSGVSQGGSGGNVSLSAANQLAVFAPIMADGGPATVLAATPTGGTGGNVTLVGNGGTNVWTTVSMRGGDANGFVAGAVGGAGGTFAAGSAAPYSLFGSIVTAGGSASAHTAGAASLDGGTAGAVNIGVTTPVSTLQLGLGTYTTNGGSGAIAAGNAGGFDIESSDGNVSITATLKAHGGDLGVNTGGAGGAVTIKTDQSAAGNTSNHTLSIAGSIDSTGGNGDAPGASGTVVLQSGSDLTLNGSIDASGHGNYAPAASVALQVVAAHLAPTGTISIVGSISAQGADLASGFGPGRGNNITLSGAGGVTMTGTLNTRGGGNGGGGAGSISIQSVSGDIGLSGSVIARGDAAFSFPPPTPGNLTVSTSGNITNSATIDVSALPTDPGNSNVQGAAGGSVTFTSSGPSGAITLLPATTDAMGNIINPGSKISANGANSTPGSSNRAGGGGGIITLSTLNQAISISGSIQARGGDTPADSGGLGGQVIVNSNSSGAGSGGAITLTSGSTIDVSGGNGFTGGSARNNGGIAPLNSSGANLAVIFDAAGGLTASPDGSGGAIQNIGRIIALGYSPLGRGGDIWFDGKTLAGAELGPGDGGTLSLSAPGGAGAFFPN